MSVWDPLVRVSHWALAALVVFDLAEDSGGLLHRSVGYAAAAVVGVRLLWGLLREGPASIRDPLPSVRGAWHHARALLHGRAAPALGHNPLGLWMVWLLWLLVLALALTGWMSRWDRFWGEEWLQDVHGALADALLASALLHVSGVIVTSRLQRENLARAMVTGRKSAPAESAESSATGAPPPAR